MLKHKNEIDFSKWRVFFADERYVEKDHPTSNFKACKDAFLSKVPIPEENIFPLDHSVPLDESARLYEKSLLSLCNEFPDKMKNGLPVFDLVLLGMGPDGHTCSLFPGHKLLREKKRVIAPIFDSPKAPPERFTLTYPVLNNAKNVFFLAAGGSKKEAITQVIVSERKLEELGDGALPAARVRPVDESLVWFIDSAAASTLST